MWTIFGMTDSPFFALAFGFKMFHLLFIGQKNERFGAMGLPNMKLHGEQFGAMNGVSQP